MSKNHNVPQVRFKGFTDAWEQRELGKVFTIRNEKNGDRYTREDVLAVSDTYGCVNQIEFHGRSFAGEDISNYKVVQTGDIVYTKSPLQAKPYGIIKIVGEETGIISPLYVVNETANGIDPMFMYYLFDTPERTNNYLSPLVRKGAKNTMNISNEEWLSGIVTISPSEQEQKTIGSYFKLLDALITLHQRKCDSLKKMKKAMLQKMFPKNGESVPEIRFKGFTDAWEQRKLGEMMNVTSVKRIHQSDWTSSGVRFLRARDIVAAFKNEEPSDYLYISEEKYSEYSLLSGKVKIGDLLVTGVGTIGVPMLINSENPLYFKDGNIIWFQNENKINGDFFYYSFIGNAIQSFIQESAGTGTVGTYTIESGKKTPIALPKDIAEQQQIGTYFRNLDNLITLHQRKLETLKKLKKSMLQKMFV